MRSQGVLRPTTVLMFQAGFPPILPWRRKNVVPRQLLRLEVGHELIIEADGTTDLIELYPLVDDVQ